MSRNYWERIFPDEHELKIPSNLLETFEYIVNHIIENMIDDKKTKQKFDSLSESNKTKMKKYIAKFMYDDIQIIELYVEGGEKAVFLFKKYIESLIEFLVISEPQELYDYMAEIIKGEKIFPINNFIDYDDLKNDKDAYDKIIEMNKMGVIITYFQSGKKEHPFINSRSYVSFLMKKSDYDKSKDCFKESFKDMKIICNGIEKTLISSEINSILPSLRIINYNGKRIALSSNYELLDRIKNNELIDKLVEDYYSIDIIDEEWNKSGKYLFDKIIKCLPKNELGFGRKKKTKFKLIKITKSNKAGKKMMAVFENTKTGRRKTTHFGAQGMSDYTKHKDVNRKKRYDARHKRRENWNDPTSAGALSKWILWNKPSLKASIADYKRRFRF